MAAKDICFPAQVSQYMCLKAPLLIKGNCFAGITTLTSEKFEGFSNVCSDWKFHNLITNNHPIVTILTQLQLFSPCSENLHQVSVFFICFFIYFWFRHCNDPGSNIIKLFDIRSLWLFITRSFQPSLMFASKARAFPRQAAFRYSTLGWPSAYPQTLD